MAYSSGFLNAIRQPESKAPSKKTSTSKAKDLDIDLLEDLGLVRASDLAFPSGDNVFNHSPNAPFVLDQRELASPAPPKGVFEFGRNTDFNKLAAQTKQLNCQTADFPAESVSRLNSCVTGFGSPNAVWTLVCCDPKTRAFLRAHPLFSAPLHAEPSAERMPVYVADTPGGYGKGLFAARAIPRNTVMFREPPLLLMQSRMDPSFIQMLDDMLDKSMHPRTLKAYDALFDCWPPNELTRRLGIARTNQVGVDFPSTSEDEVFGGTFELLSRVNHSCEPNAEFHWEYKTFQCSLVSTRDIAAGEEVTFNYSDDLSASKSVRQAELQRRFRFTCACSKCSSE